MLRLVSKIPKSRFRAQQVLRKLSDMPDVKMPELKFEDFYKTYLKEMDARGKETDEIKSKLDARGKEAEDIRIKMGEKFGWRTLYQLCAGMVGLSAGAAAAVNYFTVHHRLDKIDNALEKNANSMENNEKKHENSIKNLEGMIELEIGKTRLMVEKLQVTVEKLQPPTQPK